jgi:hypothetical protein
MKDGVIADFEITERCCPTSSARPITAMLSGPGSSSASPLKSPVSARSRPALKAKASEVYLVDQAWPGHWGRPAHHRTRQHVEFIGGSTAGVAVISLVRRLFEVGSSRKTNSTKRSSSTSEEVQPAHRRAPRAGEAEIGSAFPLEQPLPWN